MELLGAPFSIPIALIASLLYCFFLQKVVLKSQRTSRLVRITSYSVLAVFVLEIVLVISVGAVRCRNTIGLAFTVFHLLLFFLTTPALAGALVLSPRGGVLLDWYASAFLCTLFALILIFVQAAVSEALYGIDDKGGPYSMVVVPEAELRSASPGLERGSTLGNVFQMQWNYLWQGK